MICRTCKKTLIRIKVCNLKLLIPNSENNDFSCSLCHKNKKEDFIPLLCCFKCKFKMCPECAFSKIEKFEPKMIKTYYEELLNAYREFQNFNELLNNNDNANNSNNKVANKECEKINSDLSKLINILISFINDLSILKNN